MKASRKRPKGAFRRPFGLVLCGVVAMPNSIGHQDLAALIARQPGVTERWRAHVRHSTFGTIHAATFSFPRPMGAAIPDPFFIQLAALDPRALEITGSVPLHVPIEPVVAPPAYDFPVVDRRLKGDRLTVKAAPPASPEPARSQPSRPSKTKDQASLPPAAEAEPLPLATKGDRLKPRMAQRAEAVSAKVYRRAGIAAGQVTQAKRMLGTGPRMPLVVAAPAEPPAKVLRRAGIAAGQSTEAKRVLGTGPRKPVVIAAPAEAAPAKVYSRAGIAAGQLTQAKRILGVGPRKPIVVAAPAEPPAKVLRRAGIAAGQETQAKRTLGTGPRKPVTVAVAKPEPAPVTAVEAEVPATTANPLRRAGLAAVHLNAMKTEARRARAPLAETADLESQRADLSGPIVPLPAPVAEAAPVIEPAPEAQATPRTAEVAPAVEPVESVPAIVETIPSEPEPAVAAIVPPASAPDVEAVVPPADEKHPDRFNTLAVEQLSQYANPQNQTRVYFGTRELGIGRSSWEAWEPDEIPTVLAPPHVDTEIKRAALDPDPDEQTQTPGETIAPKGEVTGEGKRPRTPAERLNLVGASRAKHERCLANAIYFEARGEVERGQMAVAQVVLNRAFSGYYPGNVCDVVYQNAHRHLACQFTFACDNHKDVVRDQPRWEIATRIAADALDGKFWLPEIGKATHYHATYVNPWWVRTMTKHSKLGVHIFYRPKRWGDGEDIPVWGDRLEMTGSIKREASPATPEKKNDDKRAETMPATSARRSIFDPVEPINLPGG